MVRSFVTARDSSCSHLDMSYILIRVFCYGIWLENEFRRISGKSTTNKQYPFSEYDMHKRQKQGAQIFFSDFIAMKFACKCGPYLV